MDSDYLRLKSGSDVRGIAVEQSGEPVQLDETVARRVGAAFADWLCNRMEKKALTVAVGRDSRTTGPALAEAVCRGLASRKVRVLDCGLCTTPAMFMTTVHPDTQCDGAVMVTASHLPWYRNGLKFFTAEGGLEGTEITSLLRAASALDVPELPTQTITVDFLALYQEMLMEKVRTALLPEVAKPLLGLHVVVDAGNGAGGFFE
ncbi:MAG: phosphomannomutase/phosphoglucomutase, partial [Clostridia bacterium]